MEILVEILNFVNDNYIVFSIVLVLCLMAIIGYYAEKTNFGNKLKKFEDDNIEKKELITRKEKRKEKKKDAFIKKTTKTTLKEIGVIQENLKSLMTDSDTSEENSDILTDDNLDLEFDKIIKDNDMLEKDLSSEINKMAIEDFDDITEQEAQKEAKMNSKIDIPDINEDDMWDI